MSIKSNTEMPKGAADAEKDGGHDDYGNHNNFSRS